MSRLRAQTVPVARPRWGVLSPLSVVGKRKRPDVFGDVSGWACLSAFVGARAHALRHDESGSLGERIMRITGDARLSTRHLRGFYARGWVNETVRSGNGPNRPCISHGFRSNGYLCDVASAHGHTIAVRSGNGPYTSWLARLSVDRIFAAIARPRSIDLIGSFGERTLQFTRAFGGRMIAPTCHKRRNPV